MCWTNTQTLGNGSRNLNKPMQIDWRRADDGATEIANAGAHLRTVSENARASRHRARPGIFECWRADDLPVLDAEALVECVEKSVPIDMTGPQTLEPAEFGRMPGSQVQVEVLVPEQVPQHALGNVGAVEQTAHPDPPVAGSRTLLPIRLPIPPLDEAPRPLGLTVVWNGIEPEQTSSLRESRPQERFEVMVWARR